MNKLLASQVIKANNRVTAAFENGGSREQWEDITDLFTPTSSEGFYTLRKDNLAELINNIPIRITVELCSIMVGYVTTSGTTQLYVTKGDSNCNLSANTILDSDSFTGILILTNNSVGYHYGIDIEEETKRPKILKVERLMGVN